MTPLRLALLAVCVLSSARTSSAEIPLTAVTVLGSSPRVLTFPAAATLSSLSLMPGALRLTVTHATPWPAVAIDQGDPAQAATLWVFLKINGTWYATGAERLRPGQITGDPKPEDANVDNFIGVSWLYDAGRWGAMAGYVPQVGESVGMMVVAGSTRSDDNTPVQERTKLIEFAWPGARGAAAIVPIWTEGDPVTPPPVPVPPPTPTPTPTPPSENLATILTRLDNLTADVQILRDRLGALEARVGLLEARPVWRTCSARVFGVGVSCTLVP